MRRRAVFSFQRLLLTFVPTLFVFAACGGGDDVASGDDDDDADARSSANNSRDEKGSNDVTVPAVKDGVFAGGSVRIEYSGGKDFKADIQGNGVTQGGFTLLTFASEEASIVLSFQPDSEDDPGGLLITTKDISTAGEWGGDCSVSAEDGAKELKGEFECDEIEGVEPGTAKSHKIRVQGNFSVSR